MLLRWRRPPQAYRRTGCDGGLTKQETGGTERNMIIDQLRLLALANNIVTAGGSSPVEAAIVAEHLIEANLRGHDSHGVGMLVAYVRDLEAGTLKVNQT